MSLSHPSAPEPNGGLVCGQTEAGRGSQFPSVSISSSHPPLEDTNIWNFTRTPVRPQPFLCGWGWGEGCGVVWVVGGWVLVSSCGAQMLPASAGCRRRGSISSRQWGTGEARSNQWGQTSHSAYLASQHCCLLRKTFSSQRALFLRTRNIFTVATQAGREEDRRGKEEERDRLSEEGNQEKRARKEEKHTVPAI